MKKKHYDFAAAETILVAIIVCMVVGLGYYAYKANKDAGRSLTTSSSLNQDVANAKTNASGTDVTKDWKAYSNSAFSLKYPPGWAVAKNPELCGEGILLLGADSSSVGVCGSEGFGQMSIAAIDGNQLSSVELQKSNYPDLKTEAVVVAGVAGSKQTGTYHADGGEGIGPASGEIDTVYSFVTNNRTYIAIYRNESAKKYPDVKKDFELMITKTLKFNP